MPTNTANLNLFKYGSTDGARTFNIDEALNANWDKIDEAVAKKYTKASTGIPELDLDSAVKAALGKARTALQSVTKADVGLGNVDNTSDANKPISTAQQTALNLKANIASPTFTGTPKSTTAAAGTNTTQIATTAFVKTAVDNSATTIDDSITTHKADNVSHDTYVTCATSETTAEKVVTVNGFTLVEGARITVKFANANTATVPTLKINTEVAKPLVKADGTAFKNIKAGVYSFVYSGSNFTVQGEGGEYGTATASDVLAGKTIGTENGTVTGNMPNRGTFNLGLGVSVPAGYYSGGTTASGKRYLSGTATSGTGTLPFQYAGTTGTNSVYYVTVTGLTFKPSTIIMIPSQTWGYIVVYSELNDGVYPKTVKAFNYTNSSSASISMWNFKGDVASVSVTSSGFVLPCASDSFNYTWLAIE